MKRNLPLVITSLLSILLMTFHMTQDTLYARAGTPEAAGSTLVAVPILVVWLYGTLVRPEGRLGHVIMLVGSIMAISMPAIHLIGPLGVLTASARVRRGNEQVRGSILLLLDAGGAGGDGIVHAGAHRARIVANA